MELLFWEVYVMNALQWETTVALTHYFDDLSTVSHDFPQKHTR